MKTANDIQKMEKIKLPAYFAKDEKAQFAVLTATDETDSITTVDEVKTDDEYAVKQWRVCATVTLFGYVLPTDTDEQILGTQCALEVKAYTTTADDEGAELEAEKLKLALVAKVWAAIQRAKTFTTIKRQHLPVVEATPYWTPDRPDGKYNAQTYVVYPSGQDK